MIYHNRGSSFLYIVGLKDSSLSYTLEERTGIYSAWDSEIEVRELKRNKKTRQGPYHPGQGDNEAGTNSTKHEHDKIQRGTVTEKQSD